MNIVDGLKRASKLYPQKNALICGDAIIPYGEFFRRVVKLSSSLSQMGLKKGDRIALLMLNCHRYLELYYAIAYMGAVVVPINTRLGKGEITYILNDSESYALVVDNNFLEIAQSLKSQLKFIRYYILTESKGPADFYTYEALVERGKDKWEEAGAEDGDTAGLFYTSGTTGEPKGVMLPHKNLVTNAYAILIGVGYQEDEVHLHAAPMFHLADGAVTFGITYIGGTHVFIPSFSPEAVLKVIEEKGVTSTLLVPTMVNMLVESPNLNQYSFKTLRRIMYGAAPMPLDLLRKAVMTFHCNFFQGYGLTETSPTLTLLLPKDHVLDGPPEKVKRLSSCGREVVGVEVRVVNEKGDNVKPGEIGEIVARGPNIMKGYWKKPEETAKALINGWLYTGDMATVDEENYVYIIDRKKDMIISGGENIYSAEVENVLYSHPAVLEAAVIGVPDEKWGEVVKAFIVLKEGWKITGEEITSFCKEMIAHYKAPKSVEFLDGLPKSGSGKILKRSLRGKHFT